MKRLIICCDGTWNDSISTDSPLTNVARISRYIPRLSPSGVVQVVSYYNGIGSTTSGIANLIDGATGRGISANIREAYTFICHNYEERQDDRDEIMLMGFSRGAFTVRAIASFIADVGLLEQVGLVYMLRLYRLWAVQQSRKEQSRVFTAGMDFSIANTAHEALEQETLEQLREQLIDQKLLRTGIRIKVCVVWDTVGSLGFPMPGPIPQRASKKLAHVNSTLLDNIDVAIQALALNERRKHFQPTVWQNNGSTKLNQCWFLGAHSDVGGGNKDTGLANLALVWIIAQLDEYISFDHKALTHTTSHKIVGTREEKTSISLEFGIDVGRTGASIKYYMHEMIPAAFQKTSGKITNSLQGPFLFGGAKSRKPGQYLMGTSGLYRNSKSKPVQTNETIHWTVRVLLGQCLRECRALQKYATSIENDKVTWNLYSKNGKKTAIHLAEAEFSELELNLLRNWMETQRNEQNSVPRPTRRYVLERKVGDHQSAKVLSSSPLVRISLSDVLLPLLGEAKKPTISFPPRAKSTSGLAGASVVEEFLAETESPEQNHVTE